MSGPRTSRHRLAAAITVALAVTVGTLSAAPAAVATTTAGTEAAPGATAEQGPLTMPAGAQVVGSGPSGFLATHLEGTTRVYTWTRHEDGVQTRLPGSRYAASPGTDIVVRIEGTTYTYVDMSTGAEVAAFDTATFGGAYSLFHHTGTTLVAATYVNNHREVHLFSRDGQGRLVDRKLTGVPDDAAYMRFDTGARSGTGAPDTLLVLYGTRPDRVEKYRVALVDVATAAVVETYDAPGTRSTSASAVSSTHAVWTEWPSSGGLALAVTRRGSTETERLPLGKAYSSSSVKLMGDWVVYGTLGGGTSTLSTPLHKLTARSLKTGETVELLDHASTVTQSADGSLMVTAGTVAQGEGIYRIAPDETGRPAASLRVTTGVPTVLTVKGETAPPSGVVDLDRNGGSLKTSWTFNRHNATVRLVIRHTETGRQWDSLAQAPRTADKPFDITWDGTFNGTGAGLPAHNGDYTWTMTAQPANGIGPDVVRSGAFTVARAVRPHDFNDNGSPDLLIRSRQGLLNAFDGKHVLNTAETNVFQPHALGSGWGVYDEILTPGNAAGTPYPDLLGRDRTGVLWLYQGTGKGFSTRARIGGGWQIYNKLAAGSDVTGDGRTDLLATDTAGVMWLYKGTGSTSTPYANRVRVGAGWNIYDRVTATGNLAGAPAGDLVARDKAGVLWTYLGKGDGTFDTRTRVSGGWSRFDTLVAAGDTDGDGRNDLVAYDRDTDSVTSVILYRGTGSWKAPFASGSSLYNYPLHNMDPSGIALGGYGETVH
ncbi:FG-GAP repeat domain-containing protein [Streptomyces sp. NPDC048330]|uniref:FG-GAP repeat domain-containing protein n=1 Tax=Streptomyces sp. NPDC048330 TaxID=3365533 RepID=UPI003719EDAE